MPTIPVDDWYASGHTFAYRGHPIFFRDAGPRDAPTLLLIHGFPTSSWDWEALWPALTARWRTIAPDLLGFGGSAKPRNHTYSIAGQADMLDVLMSHLGIVDTHLLAHDYGDTVAQELLARRIDSPLQTPHLRSVCFLNGGLFPETHRAAFIQKLLLSPLGPLVARLTSRSAFERNLRRIFGHRSPPDAEHLAGFWTVMNRDDGRAVLPQLIRYIVERRERRARWVGALQATPVPLALICGGADPISGAHMAARWRELLPDTEPTLLDDVGHYPQVEAPAAVLDAYLGFRTGLPC
jgi:pimeloyl-ACP methyl ester carboxylesterase